LNEQKHVVFLPLQQKHGKNKHNAHAVEEAMRIILPAMLLEMVRS
jgi:hypothetical protein